MGTFTGARKYVLQTFATTESASKKKRVARDLICPDCQAALERLTEATPLKALFETPEKFVGKTIRIDGVATAVCQEMGCWMALGESAQAENSVRLKVTHDGKIVFPISAKGKTVSAEGVFVKVSATDKESKETIKEQAAVMTVTEFSKTYQINTTGAVIK